MAYVDLVSLEETQRLGRMLASCLVGQHGAAGASEYDRFEPCIDESSGVVIGLNGTLGAGKTNFAQALISTFGVPQNEITSPTFSLIQSYQPCLQSGLSLTIHHLDAYRVADEDEFLELGVEDILGQPGSLSLVEWAEKVVACLPADTLWIELEYVSHLSRKAHFSSRADRWRNWIDQFLRWFTQTSHP